MTLTEALEAYASEVATPETDEAIRRAVMAGVQIAALLMRDGKRTPQQLLAETNAFGRAIGSALERAR